MTATVGRPRKTIEAAEQYLGPQEPFHVNDIDLTSSIEVVDKPLTMDKADMERFMNEMVTVIVHDSNDDSDDPFVQTWVNGRMQMFLRGRPQTVRRCYVEALARSTRTTYKQKLDERLGESVFNMMTPHRALRYPFAVIEDPSGAKGHAWLQTLLANSRH